MDINNQNKFIIYFINEKKLKKILLFFILNFLVFFEILI